MSRGHCIDLSASLQQRQQVSAEVCIVGAGAAGLYLASQLSRSGRSVALLEAGPVGNVDTSAVGFEPVFTASPYRGATIGRFFGLGGSTAQWGGVLVPHSELDLRPCTATQNGWSHIVQTVHAKTPIVLQNLGYRSRSAFEEAPSHIPEQARTELESSGLYMRTALHMPFRRKNFVDLLDHLPLGSPKPRIFFNAVARNWFLTGNGSEASIARVAAVSRNRNELLVDADNFVIAAGAIESARILLEIDRSGAQPVVRQGAATGCYLTDHLSVPIAEVAADSLNRAADLFAPRFAGAWMRTIRFIENNVSADTPRAFAHFVFPNESPGFKLARKVFRAVQARRVPSVGMIEAISAAGDLVRLTYDRYARSVLHVPVGITSRLQLDMEQEPVRGQGVRLTERKDAYGRPGISINWNVSTNDLVRLKATARRFLRKWPGRESGLPQLHACAIDGEDAKPHDAYHPAGTCRMGDDREAVVDYDLKVWGVRNLWISSTGVLPSAGTANPTFTMLCLTHRLSERLNGN